MLRKITRIFFRTGGTVLLLLLFLLVFLFFAFQTFTFQTWLGSKASAFLSDELHTRVKIDKVELEFFRKAHLKGIFILDHHNDTLLHGEVRADLSGFNFSQKKLNCDKILLRNVTAKLIKYRNDSTFNYQFLVDYFDSGKKDTSHPAAWNINFGDVKLENVNFVYRREKYVEPPSQNINFDDVVVKHTYGTIRGFKMEKDTVVAEVLGLQTQEQSGFTVNHLSTKARISEKRLLCENVRISTPRSFIKGTVDFKYASWDDFPDFIEKVQMDSELKDSTIVSFRDIAAFAKELNGLDEKVRISGRVKGTVEDMRLSKIDLAFGNVSRFRGNLRLTGLPDINSTYLHFEAGQLSTSYYDLLRIPEYPFHKKVPMQLPEEIRRLGTITYKGNFDGFLNDFTSYGNFSTGLGGLRTDLSVKIGEKAEDVSYHGKIISRDFQLGTMLGLSDFNHLTMNAEVTGKGSSTKNLQGSFKGSVQNISYNNYSYSNISLNGDISNKLFKGTCTSKDPNADVDFNGTINFSGTVPELDFISTINKLNLRQLNFTNKQDSGVLSSQILINVNGDNIENLTGLINFDNTLYKTQTRTFKLSTFDVQMEQNTPDKKIRLTSEYLNATAFGQFSWKNLEPAFQTLLYHYYPTFFKKPVKDRQLKDQLSFYVRIKKFKTINELFVPDLMISANTVMEGNFSAEENKLNVQVNSGNIKYRNMHVDDLVMILNESQNNVIAEASGRAFHFGDSTVVKNFNIALNSNDTESSYSLDWDNLQKPSNKGELKGKVKFENEDLAITNEKLSITLRDSTWVQQDQARIFVSKTGNVFIDSLVVANNNQSIRASGALSKNKEDSLTLHINNLVLQQFNPLLDLFSLKLEGVMNGRVNLSNADKVFTYTGFLNAKHLKVNDNTIGELIVFTNYHTNEKYIYLNGFTSLGIIDETGEATKNISFEGRYDLEKKEESIDINFSARPANLSLLNPFLKDIITIKSGFVNGNGKIHGSPSNIKLDGQFRLFNSEVKVDYTNVSYNITGDIEIMPDQIRFSDLLMREKGLKSAPQGTINGNIFHNNFQKMRIDYDVVYKNLLVLNTTENENKTFYGKIYGTGKIGIFGYINNLVMEIDNTTNRNSRFFLPLDGPAEIGDNDFIHFVKHDTLRKAEEKILTGFSLDMKLHATPDARATIIIDKKTGDVLNVQGQGDLNLTLNTLGKFEMIGDYVITDGDYLFTLENVINKKFDIEAGSNISWSGNPLNAEIDVTASYRQRASVAPLLADSTGEYKSRTPVDCKLVITDKLFTPNIDFVIDFPSLDATAKARINNVLSDEAELNRQVFSFLLFRTFVTPQIYNVGGGGVNPGGAAANTGSELLSNRVSEFLSTYFGTISGIRDLQLGLNYRPGSQNSNETVDLALSKQFLDNKVTVDGNFGVNNNARNSNALIGDVNVDYKLTDDGRFRLKGFNRTNDNTQVTIAGGPYTQGVGFFYRVEFETFEELWKKFKSKVAKKEGNGGS